MGKKAKHICKYCKREFSGRKKVYCSTECYMNSKMSGATLTCKNCGNQFYAAANWVRKEKGFCSAKCYFEYRWGDSHFETRKCAFCGKEFDCFASDRKVCCSKRCSILHRSEFNQGENSRFWRGGKMAPYHKEWRTFRRLALERDGYKCAVCGSDDRLQVHHIIPYRYSHDHNLTNLITLCRSCHSKEEYKVNKASRKALEDGRQKKLLSL